MVVHSPQATSTSAISNRDVEDSWRHELVKQKQQEETKEMYGKPSPMRWKPDAGVAALRKPAKPITETP